MATKPAQSTRIGSLTTPLGQDTLVLTRLDGTEGLSELFEFSIEAYSTLSGINFSPAIGAKCCVSFKNYKGPDRHINGRLVATQWIGARDQYYFYRLVLKPWFWLLSCTSNCRIFANKSVPDIIREVLGDHSAIAVYETRLTASYKPLKYCVQYRESDLDFLCRLMEESGIYYYFEHTKSEHRLIFADGLSSHRPKETGETLIYRPLEGGARRKQEHVFDWLAERVFNPGRVVLNDYDFKRPTASLLCERDGGGGYQNDLLELYDYPGRYKQKDDGDHYAKVRLEARQATDHRCKATGDAISCIPGSLVALTEHYEAGQNKRYLVIRATHSFISDEYRSQRGAGQEELYEGNYEYLSTDIPFRAPQVTTKPRVFGPQTARVVGDGEIDVDKDGCIMVQFHWDRDKKNSRRVRIAQSWSGKAWGEIVIPRVGQEVVVLFVEGDPDRPLVVGTVYNGDNTTPYPLPEEKTIAGVKSDSTEGGGGYNEFIFDDKRGSELVRLHAQKDLAARIENDETREVGHDVTRDVGNNETVDIGNVLKITAGMKIELTVASSKIIMDPMGITIQAPTITIKADMTLDASSTLTTVKGNAILTLKGGVVLIN